MAWAYILSYKVVILSKDKNSRLTKHKMIPIKERVANNHLFIRRKRVLITVMKNAWIPQPRKGVPLLLIPEYSGINKGQRVPDRSKTAHRKPLVKCFLTTRL